MSNATQHTVQVDQAIEIRNEAIRAINKIAGERHALWNDYLATVRNYDAAVAERDALAKQVSELRAALSRHGRHDNDCLLRYEANLPGDSRCTCGFSASLT